MSEAADIRVVDVTDEATYGRLPPCADDRFDHRSCDYWEDEHRGSKAARPAWWSRRPTREPAPPAPPSDNPFAPPPPSGDEFNPFAPVTADSGPGPADEDPSLGTPVDNPFAPTPSRSSRAPDDAPRKLALLTRGIDVFGSYAKVLIVGDTPAVYAQFGPLSAYPRAQRIRDLYPRLPQAPLPAVITCIASTVEARDRGLAVDLVRAVCDDLAARGFAAVEAYPDLTLAPDEASAAVPGFWAACGFVMAEPDERYPVMRLELA